jgi:hypothetical protein
MKKLLEIRVPISPTPFFFRRVHFLAASLRRLGGALAEHEFTVCVGGDVDPYNLYEALPWSTRYPLTWRWVSREAFQRDSYWETSHDIFRQHGRARFVVCADADVIFVRSFSGLLAELEESPAVAGVIAHGTPFIDKPRPNPYVPPADRWRQLYEGYGLAPAPVIHEHTGWQQTSNDPIDRLSAPYFNFGMVVAPFAMMDKISAEMPAADAYARGAVKGNKSFQLALTLAIQKHALPVRVLPFRFNFVNDPFFDELYPEELENVTVLHYARRDTVNRDIIFNSIDNVAEFVRRRDLVGSNEALRRLIDELYPIVAEEEQA